MKPDKRYHYRIESDVPLPMPFEGKFKTFPPPDTPTELNFNFGSCIEPTLWVNLEFFQTWIQQNLDFGLFLGDTIYTDLFGDLEHEHAYSQVFSDPYYTDLIRNVPNFWMYDDHEILNDYDSGPDTPYFQLSLRWWRYLFGNKNPDSPSSTGTYYHFEYGNIGFFVLDVRMYRSYNSEPDNSDKTMLGLEQKKELFKWLKANANTKVFKFIASPVPWTAKLLLDDGWRSFLTEREEIINFIDEQNISGVIFLSADVHFPLISLVRTPWLIEYSASPLQSIPLFPSLTVDDAEEIVLSNGLIVRDSLEYVTSVTMSGYAYYYGNIKVNTTEKDGVVEFNLYAYNQVGSAPVTIYSERRSLLDTIPQKINVSLKESSPESSKEEL
jgi:alkaline phosphatase D